MASKAIPVILCGRSSATARTVSQGLLPEIEVRHIILGPGEGIKQLPLLLTKPSTFPSTATDTQSPQHPSQQIPQQQQVAAIITGAAYNDQEVQQMQAACSSDQLAGVYWLRAGHRADMPPPGPAYGLRMAERVKELLVRLQREERLGKAEAGEQVEF